MELDTHGQEAALSAPTLIREDRTPRGKCCGSSWGIRSHSSQLDVNDIDATLRIGGLSKEGSHRLHAEDSVAGGRSDTGVCDNAGGSGVTTRRYDRAAHASGNRITYVLEGSDEAD